MLLSIQDGKHGKAHAVGRSSATTENRSWPCKVDNGTPTSPIQTLSRQLCAPQFLIRLCSQGLASVGRVARDCSVGPPSGERPHCGSAVRGFGPIAQHRMRRRGAPGVGSETIDECSKSCAGLFGIALVVLIAASLIRVRQWRFQRFRRNVVVSLRFPPRAVEIREE